MPFQIIQHQAKLLSEETPLEPFSRGGAFRVCLAYPNTYQAGMSNLGFHTVYSIISSKPGFYCDRTFLPEPSILKLFSRGNRTLMGWQSERPLQEFDVLAFSISFETDYLNIFRMLQLAGIPPASKDRDESHPLVIAGGAAVTVNPEAIADFVDIFVIGEGEPVLSDLLDLIGEYSGDRKALLKEAARIPGVYVPSAFRVEYTQDGFINHLEPLSGEDYPVGKRAPHMAESFSHSRILTANTEFSKTFLLEVARGCPYTCRFCCVSLHNKPFRPADIDEIKAQIDKGLQSADKIGLLGAAVGSHPHFSEILDYIIQKKGQVSFASLRADLLPEDVLSRLHRLGQKLLTLAPETGSDRLRKLINKSITAESLLETVNRAVRCGFREFRLYFMLGLPSEEDEDIQDAIRLLEDTMKIIGPSGGRLLASVNQFVPKPDTPLERFPLEDENTVRRRIKILQDPFRNRGAIRFKIEGTAGTILQAYFSRANRSFGNNIPRFCRMSEAAAAAQIGKERKSNRAIEGLLYDKIPENAVLPWVISKYAHLQF